MRILPFGRSWMGKCDSSYLNTRDANRTCSLHFAFPQEMAARQKEFPLVMETFYPGFREENGIKDYLASSRRQKYSQGIYRHYPELDRQ